MSKILRGLPGKRLLVGASTLALACASAFAWYETTSHAAEAVVSTEPEARLVKTVRVEPKPIADDRSAVGEIRPRRESDLGFRVSARLIERMVDVGASVTKGQLLARVEDQDYRNRLRSAKADQAAARAVLVEAQAAELRIRQLLASGFTTRANHDATLKNLRSAEAKLDSADAALDMANDQLGYTKLLADFDGIVTAVAGEAGQMVSAGQMVVRVADPDARDAVFDIAEAAFGNGAGRGRMPEIVVSLLSNPAVTAIGVVREVSPVAEASTRTFQVKVSLADAPAEMRFGSSVAGRLNAKSTPVVVLPGSALFDKGGKPAVWVVGAASEVELKPIAVARYEADRVIVSNGLAQGDVVVTAGVNRLRERQKVRIHQ